MIGPPARKFRMKKFELFVDSSGAGAGLASGATVAVTAEVAAAGDVTAPGDVAAAGEVASAGEVPAVPSAGDRAGAVVAPGAAGTEAPGAAASGAVGTAVEVTGAPGELIAGLVAGGGGGLCARLASAAVTEQRLTISVFFILGRLMVDRDFRRYWCGCLSQTK